jgi:hypothetical protein
LYYPLPSDNHDVCLQNQRIVGEEEWNMKGICVNMKYIKKKLKSAILTRLYPFCKRACEHMIFVPPGHFYSPIPSEDDHKRVFEKIPQGYDEIDMREKDQLALLDELTPYYTLIPDFSFDKSDKYRYCYENHYYSFSDATIFSCLVQHVKPRKIIDIGGGDTTLLMLDLNDTVFQKSPAEITVIEPFPDRLNSIIRPTDKVTILVDKVQKVDVSLFDKMQPGDILFLDSTHVSKLGSDVNYIMFEILPRLKPGVFIHVHEIFFPFEYPGSFFYDGKYWNELYLWRAFLMHNNSYEISLFNSFLESRHPEILRQKFPRYFEKGKNGVVVQNQGSSLWIKKKA